MTAEIGLLNKSAVVLAADSAVTITRANKVFNNATKIFQLCENVPVGIMIYNNSHWMGIPMEVIIQEYKKYNRGKSFPYIENYVTDLISFIKQNFIKHVTKEQSDDFIVHRIHELLDSYINVTNNMVDEILSSDKENLKTIQEQNNLIEKTFNDIVDAVSSRKIKEFKLVEFKNYTLAEFEREYTRIFSEIFQGFCTNYKIKHSKITEKKLIKSLFNELTHTFSEDEDFTGVVIAGYGDDEIFPVITEMNLGEIFSTKLRYFVKKPGKISNRNNAIVVPFAQRDMVDTFVSGIDPNLSKKLQETIKNELQELQTNIYKISNKSTHNRIKEHIKKTYENIGNKFKDSKFNLHIQPVINSVSYLKKDDLIEIAEALVNITSLKRKTSNDLQTVGGPVDIVVITKGEGFSWIKRKEINRKEINF